ncbi:hypothetical protein BDZ97DRAFT_1929112 [Flammula alnicola]|nr:hypothetical protein BDZ97DRAFT_1929112 [Flammula alnicola]
MDLKELARRCEMPPQSFEDHIRIGFFAHAYIHTMMDCVVDAPHRPHNDYLTVLARGCQLVREDMLCQSSQNHNTTQHSPPPTITPAVVRLTPDSRVTRPVEEKDLASWRSDPGHLVGKGFISAEMVHRVFIVMDYAVKQVKGAQYDVVYEDSGLYDVTVVDPDTLLSMLTGAELIINM